jgi:cytochrome c oxidase subunit 2
MAAALVLAGLLAACGGKGGGAEGIIIDKSNQTQADSVIEIKARNFEFDQDEYRVKSGRAVRFHFISEEGVHGIKIPDTGIELKDGQSVTVTFEHPGEYEIICSIPCGTGHSKMFVKLIVEA